MAPITLPSSAMSGTPPGKVIRPSLETSILVERSARLGQLAKGSSWKIEQTGGAGFLDGDVDAAEPGAVHASEGLEVGSGIDDGDIHQDTHVGGSGDRRLHDRLGLGQTDVLGGEGISVLGC